MGQDESRPIDESSPPRTLSSRTIDGLAEYIKSGKVRKIVVMTGAGISTSAGIPDFRSPETGLYANLARLNLPYAEAVFSIDYFREHPEPFYTLAKELYPGKFRPTITHSFIRLLYEKGLLLKLFTQNIDCLEREAGVPDDKIIEAHGSFAKQSCIGCELPYPKDEIMEHIANATIPRCHTCHDLVKPDITFFGQALPSVFFANRTLPHDADLCIVMGTSLTVQPFASLPQMARDDVPRLLINQERVGDLGTRADDVLLLGDCDSGVRKLAKALGWLSQLESLWAKTKPDTPTSEEISTWKDTPKTKDELLEAEIDQLTKEVDETLNLSKWHEDKVRKDHLPATKPASPPVQSPSSEGPAAISKPSHEDSASDLSHIYGQRPSQDEAIGKSEP